VLRAEAMPPEVADKLGEGVHRAANLEDVFVLLTGEKIE
jgi:lipooligosaccharide transport system ATP-binding protein